METKKLANGTTYSTATLSEGETVMATVLTSVKKKWSKMPHNGTPRQHGPLGTFFNNLQKGSRQ